MQRVRALHCIALHEHHRQWNGNNRGRGLGRWRICACEVSWEERQQPELNEWKGSDSRTMPMESRRGEANQALPDCSLVRLPHFFRGENDKDYCFEAGEAGHRQCSKDMGGRIT